MSSKYTKCKKADVPGGVRFDIPLHCQGQIVEVEYGGFGRYVHGDGAPYKRVTDRSDGTVEWFRLDEPLEE